MMHDDASLLIRNAGMGFGVDVADVRLRLGIIAAVGPALPGLQDDTVFDAGGAALLPGLHDHHIHLQALAAASLSLHCDATSPDGGASLGARLRAADAEGDSHQWLRVTGYHEDIAGDIDRDWLDRHVAARPVRVQHRSGRLWIFNTRALELLRADEAGTPLERRSQRATGRLYDADAWLRQRLDHRRPSLALISRRLASYGVTGVTDVTPGNALADFEHFADCQRRGELLQRVTMMGNAGLDHAIASDMLSAGGTKVHLHEHDLPDFDAFCALIRHSHGVGRPVAVHCVTAPELAYALSALTESGSVPGDRIEHAALVPADWLPVMRAAGITVVTQPNFVAERGDSYLKALPASEAAGLYRAGSLLAAGVPLAAGTDAPFGDPDPWRAMQAAVDRRTAAGRVLGPAERLSPEAACTLFLGAAVDPAGPARRIAAGAPADLCLLDRSWQEARRALHAVRVQWSLRGGRFIWRQAYAAVGLNAVEQHCCRAVL